MLTSRRTVRQSPRRSFPQGSVSLKLGMHIGRCSQTTNHPRFPHGHLMTPPQFFRELFIVVLSGMTWSATVHRGWSHRWLACIPVPLYCHRPPKINNASPKVIILLSPTNEICTYPSCLVGTSFVSRQYPDGDPSVANFRT